MRNHRLSRKQVVVLAIAVGFIWGLVVVGIGILGLVQTGNQPGDFQAILKLVAFEGLLAMAGTIYVCRKHLGSKE